MHDAGPGIRFAFLLGPVLLCSAASAQVQRDPLRANASDYQKRYGLIGLDQTAVDDRGKGLRSLQGMRNFRSVLPGILYRAGGNNVYRAPKLPNDGPLPPEALENLCKQGFEKVVYLYRKGFKPETVSCQYQGDLHKLVYEQSSIAGNRTVEAQLLRQIREAIGADKPGPILVHCYNGYHESGYASAIALRQFCGLSGDEAYRYWQKNAAPGVNFNAMKNRINRFTPSTALNISPQQRAAICPASPI